jgi:EpsI family protein
MTHSLLPFAVTAALLLATALSSSLESRRVPESLAFPLDQIGSDIEGWTAVNDHLLPEGTLGVLSPTAYLVRTYHKGGAPLNLFIAYYAHQRAGESMHSPKHCLPGSGWEIWRHDSASVPAYGKQVSINNYSIQNAGQRMIMLYWYQSKERVVASEYLGKLFLARDTLLTGHTAGSIVRIMLPDTPGAVAEGMRFATILIPQVQHCFGGSERSSF